MENQAPKREAGIGYPPTQNSDETGTAKPKSNWGRDFIDSFKRNPNSSVTPPSQVVGSDGLPVAGDVEAGEYQPPLAMKLKGRHLQMIAIGGSIGTGLFVGSGSALATGGPASLVISFGLIGIMLFCTVQALGEMAVAFPVAGSFAAYSSRFLDPAWGFSMGWNYALQWLVALPLEIIAASITISFWEGSRHISPAVWVSIFLTLIIVINFFGVKGYGEAEFVFSIIKIVAVLGFIVLGVIINVGGGPNHQFIGPQYWYNPGAFNNGFKGLCSVFVTAAFAFSGTELVGLAAAESENPRKSLPTAIKQVFWRVLFFYMVSLSIIGVLVPYNDARLLNGTSHSDANASPFVIAISNAGIAGVDSVMNVVIMIAVLSVGNSSVYGSSRTLAALADQGQAPKIFGYIDRAGRPLVSIIFSSAFGFLCYVVVAGDDQRNNTFNWLLAVSGLSSIFTWGSICLCHIRFRAAWKAQGRALDDIAFHSQAGVIGSWVGLVFNCLVLVAQFWTAFAPVGYEELTTNERIEIFFQSYLSVPIVIIMYVMYKFVCKTKIQCAATIDLDTGVRELNVAELVAEERAEKAKWPFYKRWYNTLC